MVNLAWLGFILWSQCIFQLIPPRYSHLQASIYKTNAGGIIFFNCFSVFKVLLLNISKTYSDSDCWETNLRVSPFKGDQHHAYHPNGSRTACNLLWVCLLGKFYRNRKIKKDFIHIKYCSQSWDQNFFFKCPYYAFSNITFHALCHVAVCEHELSVKLWSRRSEVKQWSSAR